MSSLILVTVQIIWGENLVIQQYIASPQKAPKSSAVKVEDELINNENTFNSMRIE